MLYECNTLRVLNLEPRVLELVKQGKLVEGHCRALLSIQDPDKQYAMALKMIERGVTVRQAEHAMQKKILNLKSNTKETSFISRYRKYFLKFFELK